ncbi:hypothetical protein SUGI_0789120 [Cryptomeria japonica]|uniref:uncharacterized protein LOC131047033 n=1 Tax=Cryptomeria japonica TaxID=3369 RepID=UPI0024146D65|nr:uncharacterized protein LOC131047033 [Cryptomeria japonica]GLJ38718.1 hypothetical protein SUGI_0789120 [Cryptomeria japonica]
MAASGMMIHNISKPMRIPATKRFSAEAKLSLLKANLSGFRFKPRDNLSLHSQFEGPFSKRSLSVRATVQLVSEAAEKGGEKKERALRVGLICGGPSAERGISLNSARSVLDHIQGEDLSVSCYYIDCELNAYAISSAQMYSNTPADFDFKLSSLAEGFKSMSEFMEHLTSSTDIVFPLIHGQFGEDGSIQELLEKAGIPFVGTGSKESRRAFDKYNASMELNNHKFVTIPNFLAQGTEADKNELLKWFTSNGLDVGSGKVVVKPACAGSSIGVNVAFGVDDALRKANKLITEGVDVRVVIEIFLEEGREFTAIVLDLGCGSDSSPVTLLPTEVELHIHESSTVDGNEGIFNYRRKYLPTRQVTYHTPPRFSVDVIDHIRRGAAMLFRCLGLRDFARIDGWFLQSSNFSSLKLQSGKENLFGKLKSGTIIFTDINLISGMEQTSFLFQQAAKVGLSHAGVLHTIVRRACTRFPQLHSYVESAHNYERFNRVSDIGFEQRQKVFVIFGGDTSERQVSLMSGTNVWLNLRACNDFEVTPFLLAPTSDSFLQACEPKDNCIESKTVWALPYSLVLRHTVEEVVEACIEATEVKRAELTSFLRDRVILDLKKHMSSNSWFSGCDISSDPPEKLTLEEWIARAKEVEAIVFIAVHGGIGEDGTLQSMLEAAKVAHTGPGVEASRICMDKVSTSLALSHLSDLGILTINKEVHNREDLLANSKSDLWINLTNKLDSSTLCVKPVGDGCSTGVARLCCKDDLEMYVHALREKLPRLLPNTLSKPHGTIEMPNPPAERFIFEPFIETDEIVVTHKGGDSTQSGLIWKGASRWVEVTVGVMGSKGKMHSFNPSITVKEDGDILSLEEKFQGGTGINLTPPPVSIIREDALQACIKRIEILANTLGLEGFSRIDAFVHADTGEVLIIEVNTVPGMTPSTVLIHQALTEDPPMYPREFFRSVTNLGLLRFKQI